MSTVLILGATSDMAAAIANKFASKQHAIQLAARNTGQLTRMQTDISIRYQVACSVHAFDALDFNSHQAFYDQLSPKPDIAVCVFGYLGENEKARTDWKEAETIISTNYTGAVSILNIISNDFAAKKSGTIVGISSVAGERGRQSNYMYGSAKAGFTAYLSGLRNRLFKENVHVLTVQPGFAYTRMTEGLKLPKPLTAQPAEIGEAVYKAVQNKTDVVYVRWMWRWIMQVIRLVPEFMFKKIKAVNQRIAFFDFDGTITTKDTLLEFIRFCKGSFHFYLGFLACSPFLLAYKLGLIPNYAAKQKVLQYFFTGEKLETFQQACEEFAEKNLPALLRPKALQEIKKLQEGGSPVVIVSASAENWISSWAARNGLQLLGTRLAVQDGKLTGKIQGNNCHGDEKVCRIKERYNLSGFKDIYCYGDTSGDKPMLAIGTRSFHKPFR